MFVTVIPFVIETVGVIAIFAEASIVREFVIEIVPVFVIEPVPSIVFDAVENDIGCAPEIVAIPVKRILPLTVTVPATVAKLLVTPLLTVKFPNVKLEFAVIVEEAVNTVLEVVLKLKVEVVVVNGPPKFRLLPETVEKVGVFAPPNDKPALKLIVPVLECVNVPDVSERRFANVIVPVETEITSDAVAVFAV